MKQLDLFANRPTVAIHAMRRTETPEQAAARHRRALITWLKINRLTDNHPAPDLVINQTRRRILHDLGGLAGVW